MHALALAIVSACFARLALAADATNVTSVVAAAVKDNKLSIQAGNATFGDTAEGVPKTLRVEYTLGDEKLKREVNEGGTLEIAAPAGKKLVITKAVYGPADGSAPARTMPPSIPRACWQRCPASRSSWS